MSDCMNKINENLKSQIQIFIDENFIEDSEEKIYFEESKRFFPPLAAVPVPFPNELNQILESKKPKFSQTLINFIDERGLKDSDVYNKAGISRQLFSKIRIHPNYKPTKSTVLLLALAMELDLDDTQELLASAGFTLSHSSRQDLIIEFLITKGIHDIFTVNDVLYEFGEATLGT